ncbi:hypothetical protein FRB93_003043 [Tulasnella sp. JGI-2019a]|nr:hypothetical protein FRB93_003043 [Tulasnella sp. JGI-2019a]
MGVSGLSTYLQERQRILSTTVVFSGDTPLQPTTRSLVVDGWAFIYKILYDSTNPWVYGGEYEAFSQDIAAVIKAWEGLSIKPHFVFDGATPAIKFPQMIKRLQENRVFPANLFFRTSTGRRNEPTFLHEHRIIPPLVYGTCVATLTELGIPCIWADGEGDQKCVEIAAGLGCWVLSNDTDFTILHAEGYAGFGHMNEMMWEVQREAEVPTTPAPTVDADDGWTPAVVPKSKGRLSRRPTTDSGRACVRGTLIPPPGSVVSFTLTVYSPFTLSTHFRIPTPFLPLLASLVGNDFTPDAYRNRFFFRGLTSSQRIERVSEILRTTLSGPRKPHAKTAVIGHSVESTTSVSPGKPDVPTLIRTAIKALCVREHTNAEVDQMADTIIDSILQYGAGSGRNGPFTFSKRSAVSPNQRLFQEEVRVRYTQAYRSGDLSPKILDLVVTGTRWTNLFLENPDVQTCARTIGWDLLRWICAVVNDGIPIGTTDEEEDLASERGRTASSIADNDEDEDELIDVIEEQSESEAEADGEERGRQQRIDRNNEVEVETPDEEDEGEDSDEDEDDPYYESYVDGVPPSLLTSALRRLRHERYLQGDASQDQTPTSGGSPRSLAGVSAVVSPKGILSPRSGIQSLSLRMTASAKPAFVTAYLRSGQRIIPFRVQVPPNLQSLIASTITSQRRAAASAPAPLASTHTHSTHKQIRAVSWAGPIQLQPVETRLDVLLCAMQSDTGTIRTLTTPDTHADGGQDVLEDSSWAVLVLALRWTVIQMAERAKVTAQHTADRCRWKQSEAKAFLRSCVVSHRPDGAGQVAAIANGQAAPASPLQTMFPFPVISNGPLPLEATPRAIDLTAQILVAVESTQHLAQVLLLTDALQLSLVERKFSGKRFHEYLGRSSPQESMCDEERILFGRLWSAVIDGGNAEWWAEEVDALQTSAEKSRSKGGRAGPTRKPTLKVQPGKLWSTLASLKD